MQTLRGAINKKTLQWGHFPRTLPTLIHPLPREQNFQSECSRQIPVQEAHIRSGHEILGF